MALYNDGKGKYHEEYGDLWNNLVPASGSAKTRQGEAVRVVGRLGSEYYRNGNMNWSGKYNELAVWLGNVLDDSRVFSENVRKQIAIDIQTVRNNGETGACNYIDEEDEYDRLTDRVVEWCQHHPEPIPNDANLPF